MSIAFPSIAIAAAAVFGCGFASAGGVTAVGLKGGLSIATLHGRLPTDALFQNGSWLGAGYGVSFTIAIGDRLSVRPEILYAANGTSLGKGVLTDPSGNPVGTYEVIGAFGYLEFPILARISLWQGGSTSPYLLAGPAVGVRLSQQIRLTGGATSATDIDFVKPSDVGLAVGGGLELGRGRARGLLEARYTPGLTPATEDSYSDSARNGDLLVMAGLAIQR